MASYLTPRKSSLLLSLESFTLLPTRSDIAWTQKLWQRLKDLLKLRWWRRRRKKNSKSFVQKVYKSIAWPRSCLKYAWPYWEWKLPPSWPSSLCPGQSLFATHKNTSKKHNYVLNQQRTFIESGVLLFFVMYGERDTFLQRLKKWQNMTSVGTNGTRRLDILWNIKTFNLHLTLISSRDIEEPWTML